MVFNVTAGGGDPLYYQWQKQGASLPGETATNLVINNVQSADAGNYSVIVSNGYGSVTSAPAALTVTSSPFHFPRSGAPITLGGPPMPSGLTDVVAVAGGYYQGLALRSNGTVIGWPAGDTQFGESTPPADLSNVVAIAAGQWVSGAVKSDGTVVEWGFPNNSRIPSDLFGVVALSIGSDHSLALKSDGTVVGWGLFGSTGPVGLLPPHYPHTPLIKFTAF